MNAPRSSKKTNKPRRSNRKPLAKKSKATAKKWVKKGSVEFASCKELYTIKGMTSNTPYSDVEQNLGFYNRASTIAKAYQFFRIKYIKYQFIARYNTFQANTDETIAFPMPQLYTAVDKSGSLPSNTSIAQLKDMGCKPRRFIKNLVVSWKPGVSVAVGNADNALTLNNSYKISPWLMTNRGPDTAGWLANDTDHKGLYWFMETAGLPGDGTYEYDAEVEVVFEFKKPLAQTVNTQPPAIKISTLTQKYTTPTGQVVEIPQS